MGYTRIGDDMATIDKTKLRKKLEGLVVAISTELVRVEKLPGHAVDPLTVKQPDDDAFRIHTNQQRLDMLQAQRREVEEHYVFSFPEG